MAAELNCCHTLYIETMQLTFTYNFFEETREATNMIFHPGDYRGLRSVIWPFSSEFLRVAFTFGRYKKLVDKIWDSVAPEAERVFMERGLRDLGRVTCYLHGISCEGWFDIDKNSIHVRVTNVKNDKELLDTILHELLHLATYDEKFSYEEREKLVDEYLSFPEFRRLRNNVR